MPDLPARALPDREAAVPVQGFPQLRPWGVPERLFQNQGRAQIIFHQPPRHRSQMRNLQGQTWHHDFMGASLGKTIRYQTWTLSHHLGCMLSQHSRTPVHREARQWGHRRRQPLSLKVCLPVRLHLADGRRHLLTLLANFERNQAKQIRYEAQSQRKNKGLGSETISPLYLMIFIGLIFKIPAPRLFDLT